VTVTGTAVIKKGDQDANQEVGVGLGKGVKGEVQKVIVIRRMKDATGTVHQGLGVETQRKLDLKEEVSSNH